MYIILHIFFSRSQTRINMKGCAKKNSGIKLIMLVYSHKRAGFIRKKSRMACAREYRLCCVGDQPASVKPNVEKQARVQDCDNSGIKPDELLDDYRLLIVCGNMVKITKH